MNRNIKKKQKMMVIALLLLLGLALAVGSGIYFHAQSHKETETTEIETMPQDALQVTQIGSDEVTGLSFASGESAFSFSKEGQEWTCENDPSVKLEQPAMESMVAALTDLAAAEEVMSYDGLSEYGLENPQSIITLTTARETVTLLLGGQNEITGSYYLKQEDDTAIHLVDGTAFNSFFAMLADTAADGE